MRDYPRRKNQLDQKSSGFNIEKYKIRKYTRFKRLYFSMCLAQLFTVMIGEYVTTWNHPLKKTFPTIEGAISAFSGLDTAFANTSSPKSSQFFRAGANHSVYFSKKNINNTYFINHTRKSLM